MGWFDKIIKTVGKSISDLSKNVFGIIPNEPTPIRTAQTRRVRQAPSAVRMGSPPRYEPVSLIVQMEQRIIDEQDERVALIQDPEIRRVATETVAQIVAQQEQPIVEMIRPEATDIPRYRLTIKGVNRNGVPIHKEIKSVINYKIGDTYVRIDDSTSQRDIETWKVINSKQGVAIRDINMINRPIGLSDYSHLENKMIQDGGNCLINTIYESVKTKTLTKTQLVDQVIKAYNNKYKSNEWHNRYNISQATFREHIDSNTNVECSIDIILPYLETHNKKLSIYKETAYKKDDTPNIECIKEFNFGNTIKKICNHNLIKLILTDEHGGMLISEDNIRIKRRVHDKKTFPKIIKPKEYKNISNDIILITDIEPIQSTIQKYIRTYKSIEVEYMYNDDDTWSQFIDSIELYISTIEIEKRPLGFGKYYPIEKRYGMISIRGATIKNFKSKIDRSKLNINIRAPYTLINVDNIQLDNVLFKGIVKYTNSLNTHVLNPKYNSTLEEGVFEFMTTNPRSCPRAIIGKTVSQIDEKKEYDRSPNPDKFVLNKDRLMVDIDMSKAYPAIICDMSCLFMPRFNGNQKIIKYIQGMKIRKLDLLLVERVDTIGVYNEKLLDRMFLQNGLTLQFKRSIDKYFRLTKRSPYRILGILKYSSVYIYDEHGHIFNTYKDLINMDNKNMKIIGNIPTGKLERHTHEFKSKSFKTIESVSSYCNDNEISIDNIVDDEIIMPDRIEHIYHAELGTAEITTNQMINKIYIHSTLNLRLIGEMKYILSKYKHSVPWSIQTDGITFCIDQPHIYEFIREYSTPTNKTPFELIGNFYYRSPKYIKQQPLTEEYHTIRRNHISYISEDTNIVLPEIFEKCENRIDIDEDLMKNDKIYFNKILKQKNILIIEGSGGTGKDFCINKNCSNVLNIASTNALSREHKGITAHSFLGVSFDGTFGKINKRNLEFEVLNISDATLMGDDIQAILVKYVLDRQSKGLCSTITLDKNQLSAITSDNSLTADHYKPLDELYKYGTVVRFVQQERITDKEDQLHIEEIIKRVQCEENPRKVLNEYLSKMSTNEIINTCDPENDIFIAQTNEVKNRFSKSIVHRRFNDIPYTIGMKMIYSGKNDLKKNICKATVLRITKITESTITLNVLKELADDEEVSIDIPIEDAPDKLSYPYAQTPFTLQGRTVYGKTYIDCPDHPISINEGKNIAVIITRNRVFSNNILIDDGVKNKNYDWVNTIALNEFIKDRNITYRIEQLRKDLTTHTHCHFCEETVFAPYFEKQTMNIIYSIHRTDNGVVPVCEKCYYTETQQNDIVDRDVVYQNPT